MRESTRPFPFLVLCAVVLCATQVFAAATCQLNSQNLTVTICTPTNGATVPTTFHANAGSTDSAKVDYMQVYVNGVKKLEQLQNFIDANLTLAAGTNQRFTVQAHDVNGNIFKQTISINVGSSSSGVTVTPSTVTLAPGATQQFTANVAVTWSASCGTITTGGLYTAPSSGTTCTVTGTDSSNNTGTATVTISSTPPPPPPPSTAGYVTWKNDVARTGQQRSETKLTPSNVKTGTFGVKFSVSVDGAVYAQPLYVGGLTVNGTTHNVVYVATEHDSVYAFDADVSGAALWKKSFLVNGATTVPQGNVGSTIFPEIGITGTPVIDRSKGLVYVVAETLESGAYVFRLHALDLQTGGERLGGPIKIAPSGFQAKEQLQRPALLEFNGNIYIAFGSQGDHTPYHGWVMAHSASTLQPVASWNVTPGGTMGAIWMSGAGPAADSTGIYVATSNGSWNGTTQYSTSVVRLSTNLVVQDWFTPFNQSTLSSSDKDLGSGGPLLVPTQSGAFPHELIQCGKAAPIYVLNRDNLGRKGATSDSQIIQKIPNAIGGTTGTQASDHCFSTAAYWQGNVYFVGNNDALKQFTLNASTGLLSTAPVAKSAFVFAFPGAQPVTSSNGTTSGIVWVADRSTATLRAYDATNVSRQLYVSGSLGTGIKWAVPTVVNGKVYVGTKGKLYVFGLL